MSITAPMLGAMGAPPLEPATVHLTAHVVDRYMERRGWPRHDSALRLDAVEAIRNLLFRVCHQRPAVFCPPGKTPTRRYQHGGLCWIVSADNRSVITFYSKAGKKPRRWR